MKKPIKDLVIDSYDPKTEVYGFLMLSGELGDKFLDIPKRKRKVEDYAKLMTISLVFEFKRMFVKLCKEGESKIDKIVEYIKTESKNALLVESWINEAIDNIFDDKLKAYAIEVWESKKSKLKDNDFDITKMI